MKILVLGGAGYIGSHVVRRLLDRDHEVTVFDNLSTGTEENLFPEARFIRGDILNPEELTGGVTEEGYDGAVHLAAFKAAGESMVKPEKYSVNNITGTINILNAVCKSEIPLFLFSGSAAIYGNPQYLPIDENHPTEPENFYGFTKLEIERLLSWYSKLKGIRYAVLRYFNAAGYDPGGRIRGLEKNPANLLPVILEVAAGKRKLLKIFGNDYPTKDGTGVRDYIHVTDLAEAHLLALEHLRDHEENLTVNLGSEAGYSVLEILETAREVTGKQIPAKIAPRREGDPAKLVASANRARQVLGWKAQYSGPYSLVKTAWDVYTAHNQ